MRIDAGPFSFMAPQDLEDTTNYTFKSADDRQVLTVSSGEVPPGVSGLESLLEDRKSGVVNLLGERVVFEKESDTTLGPWPARALRFTFQDRGDSFREHWAVALIPGPAYVQISYATPVRDAGAASRFDAILRSAAPPEMEEAADRQTSAEFERRWTGVLFLDVPSVLVPPRRYSYSTPDESLQIGLSYYTGKGDRLEPSLEQEIRLEDEKVGAVADRSATTCTLAGKPAECTSYALDMETPDGNVQYACRRVRIPLENGVHVHAYARSTERDAAKLERTMDSWLSSLQAE